MSRAVYLQPQHQKTKTRALVGGSMRDVDVCSDARCRFEGGNEEWKQLVVLNRCIHAHNSQCAFLAVGWKSRGTHAVCERGAHL